MSNSSEPFCTARAKYFGKNDIALSGSNGYTGDHQFT
jgi:hypothetical protein